MSRLHLLLAASLPLVTVAGLLLAVVAWQQRSHYRDLEQQAVDRQGQAAEQARLVQAIAHLHEAAAVAQASIAALTMERDRQQAAEAAAALRADAAEAALATAGERVHALELALARANAAHPASTPAAPATGGGPTASPPSSAAPAPAPASDPHPPSATGVRLP